MSWRVTFDHATAFVAGPKTEARRRLAVCGDAAPIWVNRRDAWATSTRTANRLLDQLEARNITAVIEDHQQTRLDVDHPDIETEPATLPNAQGGLW